MPIARMRIHGFRGFATPGEIKLAVPNGVPGSGLTYLVGSNNAGKSTVIESLRAFSSRSVTISEGKRNKQAGDKVKIELYYTTGENHSLASVEAGSAQMMQSGKDGTPHPNKILVISSRRSFDPYFGDQSWDRNTYADQNKGVPSQRAAAGGLNYRLVACARNPEQKSKLNQILGLLVGYIPEWTIDQSDAGQLYVRMAFGNNQHNTDGAGEGLLNLFHIADAFRDVNEQEHHLIAIDEPELSLHPQAQRRLASFLHQQSSNLQILLTTHSPLLINWESISEGAELARAVREDDGSKLYQIGSETKKSIASLLANRNNPHILGLDASEIFFLDDGVLIVEGQEDVMLYPTILQQLKFEWRPQFFGWGAGGAGNIRFVAGLLKDLGFRRVAGLLDGGQEAELESLKREFPGYKFEKIPAKDIRAKDRVPTKEAVDGLIGKDGNIQVDLAEHTKDVFRGLQSYLNPPPAATAQTPSPLSQRL